MFFESKRLDHLQLFLSKFASLIGLIRLWVLRYLNVNKSAIGKLDLATFGGVPHHHTGVIKGIFCKSIVVDDSNFSKLMTIMESYIFFASTSLLILSLLKIILVMLFFRLIITPIFWWVKHVSNHIKSLEVLLHLSSIYLERQILFRTS